MKDSLGRVLEAKREDLDPDDAREQARGHVENLTAPFVIIHRIADVGKMVPGTAACGGAGRQRAYAADRAKEHVI